MRAIMIGLALTALAGAARAEVAATWEAGFRLENRATAAASPDKVWAALGQIGRWWDSEHSYTGDAANMTMPLEPGGCFCERFPDGGGVEHGRVVMAWPAQKTLRIHGALGPLQDEGVSAALTFVVKPAEGGGSQIVQTYNVGGARPDMVKAAPLIDSVIGAALKRLAAFAEKP